MEREVYIGLGGNIGDARRTLRDSLRALEETGLVEVIRTSSLYRTAPVGEVAQEDFLNAVANVATSLSPRGLLALLLETEQRFGRTRTVYWGPRTLDLDLLFFGQTVESMPGLEVPHPEAARRGFVLAPMAEIAPRFEHPVLHLSMAELFHRWQATVDAPESLVTRLPDTLGQLRPQSLD